MNIRVFNHAWVVSMFLLAACSGPANGFGSDPQGVIRDMSAPLTLSIDMPEGRIEVRLAELDLPSDSNLELGLYPDLIGRLVRLENSSLTIDRYGRSIAHVYVLSGANDRGNWLQGELVSSGRARVLSHIGNRTHTDELLTMEQMAREAEVGIWGESAHLVRNTHPDFLAQDIGSIQIVEGRVLDVSQLNDGKIYLNFGVDYRTDFSILIAAENFNHFETSSLDVMGLVGYRIRARGWLTDRNGPLMHIDHPERIEILDD